MNLLDKFKAIFNWSERWEDVIRKKNGQYITEFRILFTIDLRYEIRQDLVINLINLDRC